MRDPKDHLQSRNSLETVLRYIPGFRGYLEKEYRRESDELQREWLSGRLQQAKAGLDDYGRALLDAGNLDALPQCERVRTRLDKIIWRIASAMQGYSGVFDLVRVDEAVLDRVYEHDASLVQEVDALADTIEKLNEQGEEPAAVVPGLLARIDQLEDAWDQREDILRGLE